MRQISTTKRFTALFICTIYILTVFSAPVSAATFQYGNPEKTTNLEKAVQNIPFTGGGNPSTDELCPPFEEGASASPATAGGSTAEQLYNFLRTKSLSPEQAAGIVGNVMQESGGGTFNLDTNATNPSSGAYGIIQWYAGRKTKLLAYAQKLGKPKDNLQMQMDYMWIELNGSYKESVLNPILASNGLEEPTKIWLERYEIPCLPGSSECTAEMNKRMPMSRSAYEAFSGNTVNAAATSGCGSSGSVDANGYAFPVVLPQDQLSNGYTWPCRTTSPYCHHDGSPGMDISKIPNNDGSAGVSVVAIFDGHIASVDRNYKGTGCQSLQFKAADGYYYWYGHIRTTSKTPAIGKNVKAGTYLGKIGERECTGNGSYPHLHIDRGFPKGYTGGEDSHRDPAFIPLMNELYSNLL